MKPQNLPNLCFVIADETDTDLIHRCDKHQYEVFAELGYLGEGPVISEVADLPSRYFVALEGENVVGCVRTVVNSPRGFTTLNMMDLWTGWAETVVAITQTKSCEEILFSTVRKGYRRLGNAAVILNLYRILLNDARARGVEYWFTAIDEKLFPYFTMVFNFKFEQIGEPQDFLGAPSIPCIMLIEEGVEKLRKADSELADFIEGIGDVGN